MGPEIHIPTNPPVVGDTTACILSQSRPRAVGALLKDSNKMIPKQWSLAALSQTSLVVLATMAAATVPHSMAYARGDDDLRVKIEALYGATALDLSALEADVARRLGQHEGRSFAAVNPQASSDDWDDSERADVGVILMRTAPGSTLPAAGSIVAVYYFGGDNEAYPVLVQPVRCNIAATGGPGCAAEFADGLRQVLEMALALQ